MNIGTIVDADKMAVRLQKSRGGKPLGEVEEYFASMLARATPS
jgi:ATP-dependent Lhr-like helicase